MIIRLGSGVQLNFSRGLNRNQFWAGQDRQWAVIVLGVSLLTSISLGQIIPDSNASRSSQPSVPASTLAPVPSAQVPSTGVSAPPGYILTPNDLIAVEVYGEDDLRTNGRLNGEGNLSVPLLGSIHLAGLTLAQAASKLTELYGRDYLINPKVNVILNGYAARRFSVLGEVTRPGSYEMPDGSPGGIDLLEAIAMAGGYTRIAAPERVSIRRRNAPGKDQIFKVNAKRMIKESGGSFLVEPGDTITVGESIF